MVTQMKTVAVFLMGKKLIKPLLWVLCLLCIAVLLGGITGHVSADDGSGATPIVTSTPDITQPEPAITQMPEPTPTDLGTQEPPATTETSGNIPAPSETPPAIQGQPDIIPTASPDQNNATPTNTPAATEVQPEIVSSTNVDQTPVSQPASTNDVYVAQDRSNSGAAQDPYFTRLGQTFYFRSDCTGFVNCTQSNAPISAAIDNTFSQGLPDDGIINVEGGHFCENVQISTLLGPLTIRGKVDGQATYLDGGLTINGNNAPITFLDFIFNGGVSLVNAEQVTFQGSTFNGDFSAVQTQGLILKNNNSNADTILSESTDLSIDSSQFSNKLILSTVTDFSIIRSRFQAEVLIGQSANGLISETTFNKGIAIDGSEITIISTPLDNHSVDLNLGSTKGRVDVSSEAGAMMAFLRVTGQAEQQDMGLSNGKVTFGEGKVTFNPLAVQLLALILESNSSAAVIVNGPMMLNGSLAIEAPNILINGQVQATDISLTGHQSVAVLGDISAENRVIINSGTILNVNGLVQSKKSDVYLFSKDGININSNAHVMAAGQVLIDADLDQDGMGTYTQLAGAIVEGKAGILIRAADIVLLGSLLAGEAPIQLIPSQVTQIVFIGDFLTGGFNLTVEELNNIHTLGMLIIGAESSRGDVSIGSLDLSSSGFLNLNVFGGNIALDSLILAFAGMLQLTAAGYVTSRSQRKINIDIPGGALVVQAQGFGTSTDPIRTAVDVFSALVGCIGGIYVSDLNICGLPAEGRGGIYMKNNGDLTIGGQNGIAGLTSGGEIIISAPGTIKILSPIMADTLVKITAFEIEQKAIVQAEQVQLIIVPDPYIFVGGSPINYTTIQEAIDDVRGDVVEPDLGTIYILAGSYSGNLDITNLSDVIFQADGGAVTIAGDVDLSNSERIQFLGINITGTILLVDVTDISFTGTAGDDTFAISLSGSNTYTVDGAGGTDTLEIVLGTVDETLPFCMTNVESLKIDTGAALDIADFFRITDGTLSIQYSPVGGVVMPLAGGGTVTTDAWLIGGIGLDVFAGINGGTAGATGFDLDSATFGLAFLRDQLDHTHKWIALKTSDANASFRGITDLTLTGGSITVEINLKAGDGSLIDFSSHNITIGSTTLNMDGTLGELIQASGDLTITVPNFVTLSGEMGFSKSGTNLIAVGDKVDASLDAGVANVKLSEAEFGLKVNGSAVTFELSNGTFTLAVLGLVNISATNAFVQYTSHTGGAAKDEKLTVGSLEYIFTDTIAIDTLAFMAKGFHADITGFVSLDGDLGFMKVGDDIIAVGDKVDASLDAGVANVKLSEAEFGLKVNGSAVTFELSNGTFTLAVLGLVNISATNAFVQYTSHTGGAAKDEKLTVGSLEYIFTDTIAIDTLAFMAKGFHADITGFVSLDGDLGFMKVGDDIIAVGDKVDASLDAGVANVKLSEAEFGLKVNGSAVTFELSNGTFTLAVLGLVNISATNAFVQYTSHTGGAAKDEKLTVGSLEYIFTDTIAIDTLAFMAKGFHADITGFVSLDGDLGFMKVGDDIIAVGDKVDASLDAGVANVKLSEAEFGLKVNGSAVTFELSNGTFTLAVLELVNISATNAFVQYTSHTGGAAKDEKLTVDSLEYIFTDTIAIDTLAFMAKGFHADITGFVSLDGDLGFMKVGDDIIAVGDKVDASLDAGVANVKLSEAEFGLKVNGSAVTFELSNGTFTLAVLGLVNISATNAFVQYTSHTGGAAKDEKLTVGSLEYIFTDTIAIDTLAFMAKGFHADITGFVSLDGDLGFMKVGDDIIAVGDKVDASLDAGVANVKLSEAEFGLKVNGSAVTFELSNGTFTLAVLGLVNISATNAFVQYTSHTGGAAKDEKLTVGSLEYIFTDTIAIDTLAFMAKGFHADITGFVSLDGDLGFMKVGDDIIAVGDKVDASLDAGVANVKLSEAEFGLKVNGSAVTFELSNGTFTLAVLGLVNISATNAFVQYTSHTGGAAKDEKLTVGSLEYIFTDTIAIDTLAFMAKGFHADITGFVSLDGDLGFMKVGDDIIAVGDKVDASLDAGVANVKLSEAEFGLKVNGSAVTFELSNGTFTLAVLGLVNISATNAFVQYTSHTGGAAKDEKLTVGSLEYIFTDTIAIDTLAFMAKDFHADITGFVSLDGDLGFMKVGDDIIAVGDKVDASLDAGVANVKLSEAEFGLKVNGSAVTFELSNGTFTLAVLGLVNISATNAFVQYTSHTGGAAKDEKLTVGSLEYIFTDTIAIDTLAFMAKGFHADITGFVSLDGDLGFMKVGDDIIAVGDKVDASLDAGVANVKLSEAEFGLKVNGSAVTFELSNGTFTLAVLGLVNISATNAFVQYTSHTGGAAKDEKLTVGSLEYIFTDTIAIDTLAFMAKGFHADITGFVSLDGDLGFMKVGDDIIAVGDKVDASLDAGVANVKLSEAEFGLKVNGSAVTFELSNGTFTLAVLGLVNISATNAFVQYTSHTGGAAKDEKLTVGSLEYIFTDTIAIDTLAFMAKGFHADITGFVSLDGDLGFMKVGDDIIAVGDKVDASLDAGVANVKLSEAEFGLKVNGSAVTFELSNGTFTLAVLGLVNISATNAFVQYTSHTGGAAKDEKLTVGSLEYIFTDTIAIDTLAFMAKGFHADITGFVSLDGDLGFMKVGDDIIAVGDKVDASLDAGVANVKLSEAEFGLKVNGSAVTFELSNGTFTLAVLGLVNISATNAFVQYTSHTGGAAKDEKLTVGSLEYIFTDTIAIDTLAFMAKGFHADITGFVSLDGDLGFMKVGDDIIAVGDKVDASLDAGVANVKLSEAEFGLKVNGSAVTFELSNGTFTLAVLGLVNISATNAFVQYTSHTGGAAKDEKLTVGSLEYIFTDTIAIDTLAFMAKGFHADITGFVSLDGDLGFMKVGDDIIAVGDKVDASLDAGVANVKLSEAEFGLKVNGSAVTFELSNGTFTLAVLGLVNISATNAFVQYTSHTGGAAKDEKLTVGSLEYIFTDTIAIDTLAFMAKGFHADITGFVSLDGDLGFMKVGDDIIAVGDKVDASLDAGVANVKLSEAEFGLKVNGSAVTFELSNGTFTLAVLGLVNISATNAFVQYTSHTGGAAKDEKLTVGSLEYIFTDTIAIDTLAFMAKGFHADITGFVSLDGDLGFMKVGDDIIAVGDKVDASLDAGVANVKLSEAEFGLKVNGSAVTFELSNGTFTLAVLELVNISATNAFVQYTSHTGGAAKDEKLTVGSLEYIFTDTIAIDTLAFMAKGFHADITGFVSLDGDLGFMKVGDDIIAVGDKVDASLDAGVANVKLSEAEFGLKVNGSAVTFELSNGTFTLAVLELVNISATNAFVQYTSHTGGAAKDEKLTVGSLEYIFTDTIAIDTLAFMAKGFHADITGFVSLDGDLGFMKVGDDIIAVGDKVDASLDAGVANVKLSEAEFGLKVNGSAVTFELSNGTFTLAVLGLVNISATNAFVQYTSHTGGAAKDEKLTVDAPWKRTFGIEGQWQRRYLRTLRILSPSTPLPLWPRASMRISRALSAWMVTWAS